MRKLPVTTVALAVLAVPLAAPASADPAAADQVVNGMYNIHFTDGSRDDLTFKATSCGIGCTQVAFANASGQAQFFADRWHANFVPHPAAWRCNDGTVHDGFEQLAWDPATGVGTMVVVRTEAACGYTSHASTSGITHPFTLTRSQSAQQPSVLPPAAP